MIKKIVITLWVLFAIVVLACVGIFAAIATGKIGYMPPVKELENPNYKFATEIFSADGNLLGTWSLSTENRVYTGYDELSADLIKALIATEDIRFSEHSGIDAKGLARAVVKRGILMKKNAGGGSTITQQLSKLLYSPKADDFMERVLQKPIEWVIAVKLEKYYTKEEILTLYLNKFDFLNNAVGIKTAAHTYFSTDPKNLKIEEAATLVGMCKNPSYYNPLRFAERSKGRRNVVIEQMEKAGYITKQQSDSLQALPLTLKYNRVDHKEGSATYFREYLRGVMTAKQPVRSEYKTWQKQKFYDDSIAWETDPLFGWCQKNKKRDGSNYSIYTDGLKIFTTIDSRMQQYAEEAVEEHLGDFLQDRFFAEKKGRSTAPYSSRLKKDEVSAILDRSIKQSDRYRSMKAAGASDAEIEKAFNTPESMSVFTWKGNKDTILTPLDSIKYYKHFLRAGFLSMNPMNGHVKAYVGGPNYNYFQYDMAMVGRRQVGSTVKPFLYTLAMESGYTPCDVARHVEYTLFDENGTPWSPRNSIKDRYGEMVTLKWGLSRSSNWISAYLIDRLNPYALVRLIHDFGAQNQDIVASPSLSLGPCEISVGEMVGAYTAFANKGIRVSPLFVTRIEDNEGNVLATFTPRMKEVISVSSTYKMLDMLRAVVNEGTGNRAKRIYQIKAEIGGKTGTTNYNSDGWFIGFTPSLVSGVWIGGEERDIHFDTMTNGQGAVMALPIWGIYMKKVLADETLGYDPEEKFQFPKGYSPCGPTTPSSSESEQFELGGLDDLFN
ncbi:transglycosylase domain-containing protein [Bacteroides sp. 519]|uniref:transglycosylase domain-containing protein n=1 Tax=Bacteroides sp. 519 TaxID=2302937 RepID=UPI0013D5398B|nr:transglycosylase domain-containing protein [Bacteroides sp. 519]NDV58578.1 penicillin-binding protein [Bacteroides sp. 519]